MQERVEFTNTKGNKLVGVLHTPKEKTSKIVVIAHGFCANKDRERLIQIGETYSENNIAAFRFDFSGSGESDEDEITVENQIDDLKSAIAYVKSLRYEDIGIQGESLGGLVALEVWNSEVKTMVLWAPVTNSKDKLKEVLVQEKLSEEELNEKGYVLKKKDGREFKVPKKYFQERLEVSQEELLGNIRCPVLILHGDKDDCVDLEDSKQAMDHLENGELNIIEGAGHILDVRHETFDLTLDWFKKHL